jgi:hypothetical protein
MADSSSFTLPCECLTSVTVRSTISPLHPRMPMRTPASAGLAFRAWGVSDGGDHPVGVGIVPRRTRFRGAISCAGHPSHAQRKPPSFACPVQWIGNPRPGVSPQPLGSQQSAEAAGRSAHVPRLGYPFPPRQTPAAIVPNSIGWGVAGGVFRLHFEFTGKDDPGQAHGLDASLESLDVGKRLAALKQLAEMNMPY